MNNYNKNQNGRDITCKSHSARSDRELYRICPSKLSKRELEDLYFALLENNLELKRTINGQQDQIKWLSTKVQRMTKTTKASQGKETKECCVATKNVLNEQKDSITDLKNANERMAERIRLLNMRLCSAKQFLRRSPGASQSTALRSCNNKCSTLPNTSLKNSSMSALNTKHSDGNLKPASSCQDLDKEVTSTRSVETETREEEKPCSDKTCDENKCKTLMEELQQKIINLEEELSKTHEEYSSRISRLEREVSDVRKENVVVRSERVASDHELQLRTKRTSELVASLREAEANCNDLTVQLSIERRKVTELETQLKAVNMSKNVAKNIEEHLTSVNKATAAPSHFIIPTSTDRDKTELPKSGEDSGYTDASKTQDLVDDKGLTTLNEGLMQKISDMESKLDDLKESTAAEMLQDRRSIRSYDGQWKDFEDKGLDGRRMKYEDSARISEKNLEVEIKIGNQNTNSAVPTVDVMSPITESNRNTTLAPWIDLPSTSKCTDEHNIDGGPEKETSSQNDCQGVEKEKIDITSKTNTCTRKHACGKIQDDHNKLQIPGPIPTDNKDWKKNMFKRLSIELKTKNRNKDKTKNDGGPQKQATKPHTSKNGTKDSYEFDNTKYNEELNNSVATIKSKNIQTGATNKVEVDLDKPKKLEATGKELNNYGTKACKMQDNGNDVESHSVSKDSLELNRSKLMINKAVGDEDKGTGLSLSDFYPQNGNAVAGTSMYSALEQNTHIAEKSQLELCSSRSRVCTCPAATLRDVSVFRTCSGTLRFQTTDTDQHRFRACRCSKDLISDDPQFTGGSQVDPQQNPHSPKQTLPTQDRRRSSMSDRGTYSIRSISEAKETRATSPDNTEREISSMTDLPSEKNAKSPRPPLSPGEDKWTTTYTDSYTTPATTDYGSLSEGELPANTTVRRVSLGEKIRTYDDVPPDASSSQKMEAALQAITEELARCKQLLMSQKPPEPRRESRGTAAATALRPRSLALRRANAAQSIGDVHAPKCVFTLHIGTVVLSDEAVLNSRNKNLVLMWKFYDQNVAMTRMCAGRVVLFDFSTEYDVKITEDFLNYMKHEEMLLVICELNKQDEAFASCALPLRDALLNSNRRADMSLALVAGPRLKQGAAADALDAGDELGVLDLWCMLRAEPQHLPNINTAIAKPSLLAKLQNTTPNNINSSRILEQVKEDEPSNEDTLSRDLDLTLDVQSTTKRFPDLVPKAQQTKDGTRRLSTVTGNRTTNTDDIVSTIHVDTLDYDASKYPTVCRHSAPPSQAPNKANALPDQASGIIANEVTAYIKSSFDMKQALERNANQNSLYTISRMPKAENKTMLAKLQRKHPKKDYALQYDSDVAHQNRRSTVSDEFPPRKSDEGSEVHRKYDNIMKIIGVNRPDVLKKKSVTITPSEIEPPKDEPQKTLAITVLWLALNEECEAMANPHVQRLFVAYSFLGRSGAELETPVSLPKPKHYVDKCYFNFKKTFQLDDVDLPLLGHMARCRGVSKTGNPKDCIVFTVVSEPPEDPLGLDNCEDIGYANLYLGDLVAYSAGSDGYTEVIPVRAAKDDVAKDGAAKDGAVKDGVAKDGAAVCGVLAIRVDGLDVLRRCLLLSHSQRDIRAEIWSTV